MLSWSIFVLVIIVVLVVIVIFFASLLWFSSKSQNGTKQCGIIIKNGTIRSSMNNDVTYNPNDTEGYPIMITDGYLNHHTGIHKSIFQGNLDFLNYFSEGGFSDSNGIGDFGGCDAGGGDCGGGDD